MPARTPVSAAILCGGYGRRMGGADKGDLQIDGRSILDRQLDVLRALTPHLMIIDRDASRHTSPDVRTLVDAVADAGPLAGIYTALISADTDRVVILACDMPFVTTRFLEFLCDVEPDADIVVPRDGQGRLPLCAVFHRRVAEALERRLGARLLRVEDALTGLNVREVTQDAYRTYDVDGRLLVNVNTLDDYREATRGPHRGTALA